jgi:hypothetical protein
MTFKSYAALGGALVLALGAAGAPAQAATITFETATYGQGFGGPITESGFTYSTGSGSLFTNGFIGDPGQDMEGDIADGGGVLDIVKASPGQFTFSSLDFAAYAATLGGSQTLDVTGYLGGSAVGVDSFTLANTDTYDPSLNWTLFGASNLAGVGIDDLKISLNAGGGGPYVFFETVDNVTLGGAGGVPEPAAWALMIMGFGATGAALRRRRTVVAA